MAQLVEQLIRNEQAVGSSPTISSKTCVNTVFSQAFSFCKMNFKINFSYSLPIILNHDTLNFADMISPNTDANRKFKEASNVKRGAHSKDLEASVQKKLDDAFVDMLSGKD